MTFDRVIRNYGYPLVGKETAAAIYYARRHTVAEIAKAERGSNETPHARERTIIRKRQELLGLRVYRQTGEESESPSQPPKYQGPSFFNKKQWLPLTQQAAFRIASYCCDVMKKAPAEKFQRATGRKPYLGTMTEESRMRKQAWLKNGCNAFHAKDQKSTPLAFWTEQDVLAYIQLYNLEMAPVYGEIIMRDSKLITTGCTRTGCIFCGFGTHLEKGETRFQRLAHTHPRLYEYAIGGGQWIDNPDYLEGLPNEPDEMGWTPWNPERVWVPDKKGLGIGFVFDTCNEIYGKEMWRYKI